MRYILSLLACLLVTPTYAAVQPLTPVQMAMRMPSHSTLECAQALEEAITFFHQQREAAARAIESKQLNTEVSADGILEASDPNINFQGLAATAREARSFFDLSNILFHAGLDTMADDYNRYEGRMSYIRMKGCGLY